MMAIKVAHSYHRRPPNLFNLVCHDQNKLRNFFTVISQQDVHCPIEGVSVLQSCFIYEAKFVLNLNRYWEPSTVVDFDMADHFRSIIQDIIDNGDVSSLEQHEYPTFLIAKAGSGNYGHVIAEILPKIINIKKLGIKTVRLLLPIEMTPYFALIGGICKSLGVIVEIRTMNSGELLRGSNIHIMSPVSQHDSRKSETFLELRDVLVMLYNATLERKKSIFIRRGPRELRKLINSSQIEETFVQHGFEPVYPASLSIPDQIRLFATASRIAGTLGAGLSNAAFAPQECDILMIDPGLGDYFFWDFACLLQQNFTWLFSNEYIGYNQALSERDFSLSNNLLSACLESVYS